MTTITRLVVPVLVLACSEAAFAQSANDIVERHLTASGGRAVLGKVTSRSIEGAITLTTPVGDLMGTVELMNKTPNKERTLIKLDLTALGAGEVTFDQRFDGTSGIVLDPVQGNRDITGEQLEAMKNGAFPTPLLDYASRGITLTLSGKEKVGDRDAYVLVFQPKAGPAVKEYIDAETYLIAKTVATVEAPQVGKLEQTTEMTDYRDVDGLKVPFSIKTSSSVQTITVKVSKVQHNIPIDDSLFAKPAN